MPEGVRKGRTRECAAETAERRGVMRKPGERPTLKDVAETAGVSLKTASRVLNGEPNVTKATEALVHAAMQLLGYQPNELARSLKARRSGVIGVVVPFLSHAYVAGCVQAIHEEADRLGMTVVLALSAGDPAREEKQIVALVRRQVEGLILMPSGAHALQAERLGVDRLPVVVFDQPSSYSWADSVLVPNCDSAREATEHLLAHGRRRIAAVGVNGALHTMAERLKGYRAAMHAAGCEPVELMPATQGELAEGSIAALLAGAGRPDAFFTLNSYASVQVLHAVRQCGLRIPEDVGLLCFDDFDVADVLSPSLTVVRQPVQLVGETAVRLLMERLAAQRRLQGRTVVLPTELVKRGSCG